jgi:hypothetical protein
MFGKNMKSFILLFLSLALVCSAVCQDNTQQVQFVDAVTTALKNQDRNAFYDLVSFDKLDKDWIANNKMIFEDYFRQAQSLPSFTASFKQSSASSIATLPTQQYTHPVIGTYLMHIDPDTAMNLPVCMDSGEFRIATIMPKQK